MNILCKVNMDLSTKVEELESFWMLDPDEDNFQGSLDRAIHAIRMLSWR